MRNLVCFKHPEYRGDTGPVLSCKTCCGIFIAEIKAQNMATTADPRSWLERKVQEAQDATRKIARTQNGSTSF